MELVERAPRRPANKKRLSELLVKRLKTDRPVWDTKQQGLCLRVRKSGSRSFCYVYSRAGRPRWLTLGNVGIGLAAARELAAEAMLAVARGRDPAAERKARRGKGTLAEIHHRYVNEYAKKKNKSWSQPAALIRRYVLPRWGKLPATSITRSDVKSMAAAIEKESVTNQTILPSRRCSRGPSARSWSAPIPARGWRQRLPRIASASWRHPKSPRSGRPSIGRPRRRRRFEDHPLDRSAAG